METFLLLHFDFRDLPKVAFNVLILRNSLFCYLPLPHSLPQFDFII